VVPAGVVARVFPPQCLLALLAVPLLAASAQRAIGTYEQPRRFVAAVRALVACYVVGAGLLVVGILASALT